MFKLIQSPVQKPLNTIFLNETQNPRMTYPRYSSVDQTYSRPNSSMNSSRFDIPKQQKKGLTIQKTDRSQKQRTHSQKKLTLTSAQPLNTCYNSSLSTSQNVNLINAKQAYEGFKKNLQLKTLNTTRNTPLQKRSKLTANKYNQQQKFPTSTTSIRIDSDPVILQNENDEEMLACSINFQKEKNNYLGRPNDNNNSFKISSQNYFTPVIQTAPNSPVYQQSANRLSFQNQNISNNSSVLQFCQQKISQIKSQTQQILMQNSKKISELQSLLISNKQKLQAKDHVIRQLELKLVLKQTSKPNYLQSPTSSSSHLRGHSMDFKVSENMISKSQQFLNSRISDLQKKIQVISKWSQSQQQSTNEKIDKMNNFMESFVSVKFHNLKFTLKTFVTKTEQKVNKIMDSILRVENIVKLEHVDEYERIYLKTKQFTEAIKKISQIKVIEKVHFDDMKTTMNTVIENYKHKPSKSNYLNMFESREVNESFWNNMEDFSQNKNEQYSFTDDSFSYAPGANNNINFASSNNSSVNEFPLGSFPSFSKFSGNLNKQSLQSIKSSLAQAQIGCIKTIQEISKCRQGPISIYLDKNGIIRYKSSQSYIFDRRGNTLKPTQHQLQYCLKNGWVILSE